MVLDERLCRDSVMAVCARPGKAPGPLTLLDSVPHPGRTRSHVPSGYFTTAPWDKPPLSAWIVGFGFFPFLVTG